MNLDNFRSVFRGGTRQNRFRVTGDLRGPDGEGQNGDVSMTTLVGPNSNLLVKAAQFPAATLGIIPVPFRGRIAKVVGDRQYMEWPIVVYDTTDDVYRKFQAWSEEANRHKENNQGDWNDDKEVLTNWTIEHLSSKGGKIGEESEPDSAKTLKKVTLVNCWPVEIGSIDLSYDAMDTVVEFPVTIAYDYFQFENIDSNSQETE
tara:strand:- start:678 stop:1286 length:609 start_codon:yes stop_codon:yes gene_type:complete